MAKVGRGFLMALGALVWVWVAWYVFLAPDATPEQIAARAERDAAREFGRFKSEAQVKCSLEIQKGLNDPASAEWVSRVDWPVIDSGSFYTIRATYRGANLFGATVTETRNCLATRRGDTATIIGLE